MSYLKSMATSFVYIAFFLAVVTFMPGLPPKAEFSEYSMKPPAELAGVLAPNDRLNKPEILFRGMLRGAESFDSYNGELYTGLRNGDVVKIVGKKIVPVAKLGRKCGGLWDEKKCGRILGLKFDKKGLLYVVDPYHGIFKVDVKTGKHEKLFDTTLPIDGKVPILMNSVDIADNGDVYWTESSTEFDLTDGVYIMLANPSGRLIRYNASTKKNEVLVKNLGFANGVKLSDDESHVIAIETMTSKIVKYHLKGPKAGKSETMIDQLPGIPDNVHTDGQGNYLVSLVITADPENPQLSQTLVPHPNVRKMLARLLAIVEWPFKALNDLHPNEITEKIVHAIGSFETMKFMYPQKVTVLRIDRDGKILDCLHNTDEGMTAISSSYIHDGYLWLGSPFNDYIARVSIKQAFPNVVFREKIQETSQRVIREAPEAAKNVPTTPKPEKTTSKPEKTTPKPEKTTPKPEKTTPKPEKIVKTTEKPPTPAQAPKPTKNDDNKPKQPEIQQQTQQKVPKKSETALPTDDKKKPETVKKTLKDNEKSGTKVNNQDAKKDATTKKPERARDSPQSVKKDETKKIDAGKSKQPEVAKPAKKVEPAGKRSNKIVDEM